MTIAAMPHSYPKGSMGLCPICGKSKLNKAHTVSTCFMLVRKSNHVFQCSFPVNGTCPNCIRVFCARHLDKHTCE